MSYRLARIAALTGLDVDRSDDRFRLQAATLGAQLIGWPNRST
jgi:DNA-binding PucR family transcriptional regulator